MAEVIHGNCIEMMERMEPESVDLVFADPPFNQRMKYDGSEDAMTHDEYVDFACAWCEQAEWVLRPGGSFWIAIHDEWVVQYAGWLCDRGRKLRNWITWSYGFGQHLESKFGRSKRHLLYYVKPGGEHTWNPDAIRIPSLRQTKYNDKRANPKGRVPGDVWEFPIVCGNRKERVHWHPCQMPEALLERVILACSNEGDTVLDPFAGSGTTLVVAERLGRKAIGIEKSAKYCDGIRERLELFA